MEESKEEFEKLITERLLTLDAEGDEDGLKTSDKKERPVDDRGVAPTAGAEVPVIPPEDDEKIDAAVIADATPGVGMFAKVEKSLASIGFFTPSSRRLKEQKLKKITFTREVDGRRIEVTAEIVPAAIFGLPITADQDKYLALQKIITNRLQAEGKIENPIRFKSADLLRILGRSTNTGKNYKEISDWLDVMTATTIISNGVVYRAGLGRTVRDRLHVFDRAVSFGKEMEDGTIADANYIWLSKWQLENINHNFLLPIDIETYRELKNHIAKALVPLLQIWLFASQKAGSFEKRYDELCEILNLQTFRPPSLIIRQLKPSLDELTRFEYIEKWRIEKTSDQKAYKIIFFHGAKFNRDRRRRLEQKKHSEAPIVIGEYEALDSGLPKHGKSKADEVSRTPSQAPVVVDEIPAGEGKRDPVIDSVDQLLLAKLVSRGIMQSTAVALLNSISQDRKESIEDYVDYWDSIRPDNERGKGPGLLIHLIEKNDPLPPTFETSKQKSERERIELRRQHLWMLKTTIELKYDEYRQTTVDRFVAEEMPPAEFESRVEAVKRRDAQQSELWGGTIRPELQDSIARHTVKTEIGKELNILSLEDFRKRELPVILAELNLDPAELGIEFPPAPPTNTATA